MRVGNPTKNLIELCKSKGSDTICPSVIVRLITNNLELFPESWSKYDRLQIITAVRGLCELGASTGKLKRGRTKAIKGYTYTIL